MISYPVRGAAFNVIIKCLAYIFAISALLSTLASIFTIGSMYHPETFTTKLYLLDAIVVIFGIAPTVRIFNKGYSSAIIFALIHWSVIIYMYVSMPM